MMDNRDFIEKLDATIAQHAMLDHPFYQLWNEGKLTKETLQEYAKQYYGHVRLFPRYVSAVHSACDDIKSRQLLLENVIEEEHGEENHPELWLRFAEGLGVDRDDARTAELLPKVKESTDILLGLTRSDNYLDGLGALYAYESQVPQVSLTKRQGLKTHFNIDDERTVRYFTVHEEADIEHSRVERELIADGCKTEADQERVLRSADASAKALWLFLDGVHEAYVDGAVAS